MAFKEILCQKCGGATCEAGVSCCNQKYLLIRKLFYFKDDRKYNGLFDLTEYDFT